MLLRTSTTFSPWAIAAAFIVASIPSTPVQAQGQRGEILWDRYGVPHIYAKTEEGAFYGFGYAQAKSHGNILLEMYGVSRGRAAEYWGPSYEAQDKWLVANDVPERSVLWFQQQTPQMRADLDAFAQGINDYAAANRDKLDPKVLKVLPLSGVDIIGHAHRLMNYNYVAPERRVLVDPDVNTAGGSNAWAVAPKKSASGNTLFLANPHLPWSPSLLTYYEAQITAPGFSIYGATQVGLPVLRFGINKNLAFTNTVNTVLGYQSYKLTLSDGGYMFDGKRRAFKEVPKSYKVLQPDGSLKTVKFIQRIAVQGPVFELPNNKGPIALKVAGLDRPGVLQQYLDMGKALNWKEFNAVLRRLQVPMFNIVYGDRDGHILYLDNGILPKRSGGGDYEYWRKPVAGDTSKTLWTDIHSFDELPKVLDPASGFVQNANDTPWGSTWPRALDPKDFPPYKAPYKPMSLRAQMSVLLLAQPGKISFDDFVARKLTTRSLMADRLLPDLLAAARSSDDPDVRLAVALLTPWSHRYEPGSRAALLFETWAVLFSPNNFTDLKNYAVTWSAEDPLGTPRGLKDPAAAVDMLKQAVSKTRTLYGAVDRPYGDVSRFKIGDVNLPGNGGFGNMGIFRTITWNPLKDGIRTPRAGETWVSLVEFGTPMRAVGVMSYGNSSQPGSKHNSDQLSFVANETFRTLWMDRADVEKNLEERTDY